MAALQSSVLTTLLADSDEERQDILAAYEETSGSLEDILNAVPCLEILEDEERVVALIDAAIAAKDIKKLPLWTKSLKDDKGRKQMRARAKAEASEAEQAARELGVWDELFGDGKKGTRGKGKTMRGEAQGTGEGHDAESEPEEDEDEDEEDEEDEQPTRGKKTKKAPAPKAKAPAKSKPAAKGKGKRKAEAEDDEEEGDTAGLERLIAARQQQRKAGMSTMIEQMEARAKEEEAERLKGKGKKAKGGAAAASGSGGSKGKAKAAAKPAKRAPGPPLRNGTGATLPPDPLDDDEFERIQQKMLQKRDAAAAEPAEAKPKAKRAKKA
jgi:DnaJ family protein C protein 9